jgi:signal transduction histidine kinase
VRVRDHGAGVAEEDLPHLFDRFYRGASARGTPGSGLGLAIVRQVAEQHGGSVEARNADGAEFTLRLDADPAPPAAPPVGSRSDPLPLPAAPPRHRSPTGPPRS